MTFEKRGTFFVTFYISHNSRSIICHDDRAWFWNANLHDDENYKTIFFFPKMYKLKLAKFSGCWVSEIRRLGRRGRLKRHLPLQLERHSGWEKLPPCVQADCRTEWVEAGGGAAGRDGGSGIPDTEQQCTSSHTSFRPIINLTGKTEEGGSRDSKAGDRHWKPTGWG